MERTIYTTPQDAETAFYAALEKADLDAMMSVWADDEEIICVHPGGVRLCGVDQVRAAWRQIFASGQTLRIRLRHHQALNGVTLAVHSVFEEIAVSGATQTQNPVIATNIYMRTGNGWRMVVHHASISPVPPEPDTKRAPKTLH